MSDRDTFSKIIKEFDAYVKWQKIHYLRAKKDRNKMRVEREKIRAQKT